LKRQGSAGRRLALGALLATGCAARALPPPPAPAASGLTVTLAWSDPVDLDLYVTEPVLETAYYANPRTRSGGVLERDARCVDATGGRTEQARWTSPPPGRYRVGVDFPETCAGRQREARYVLWIDVDGRRQAQEGRARRNEREPLVVEFVVPDPEVRR
jgi:hypothetical protein